MKEYQTSDIRNFALAGHGGGGKTILSDALLLCAGAADRIGSIEGGTTASDYHEDEKNRQISIRASLLNAEWKDKKFNFIDTPGYMDFISEALGALRVSDTAVLVLNAAEGIQLGTTRVWEYAARFGLPVLIVLNGCDKEHVKFDETVASLQEVFGRGVLPVTVPVNPGPGFNQVLDVTAQTQLTYKGGGSGNPPEEAPPEGGLAARVKELHGQLAECVAESDEALLEKFFEQDGLTEEEMRDGLRAAVRNKSLIPLFATSAQENVGVSRLMDFIAAYGSTPLDRPKIKALDSKEEETELDIKDSGPALLIFKTMIEPHMGELSLFRLFCGTVKTGMDLRNAHTGAAERAGQIYLLRGKNRENAPALQAGRSDHQRDVRDLKETHTGDTLCGPGNIVKLPGAEYPKPNIHGALKLASKGDEDKIAEGLAALHKEDPTFIYRADPEIKQTVISGQGEIHLQVILDRIKARFNIDIELTEPRIPFRETIKTKADSKYRHKKQTGGAGQFAEVWMRIEPLPRDSGLEFTNSLVGQNVDRVFVPSVEKGVNAASNEGILAGYRVVDLKVDFYDGKMHPVDSKDIAFQIAGKEAFREAFMKAKPCLLEPICTIHVKVPDQFTGDVMGDISGRRGRIQGMDADGPFQIIHATVPQMELYRYSTVLRSITGGQGYHTEEFSHYEEMQSDLEQKVIAAAKAAKEG